MEKSTAPETEMTPAAGIVYGCVAVIAFTVALSMAGIAVYGACTVADIPQGAHRQIATASPRDLDIRPRLASAPRRGIP